MYKKILSATVALGLVLTMSARIYADPSLDDQINSSKSQYTQSQGNVSVAEKKLNDLNSKIQDLDNKISMSTSDVNTINDKINSVQANIEETKASIEKSQNDIKTQKRQYDEIIRALYTNGNSGGYLSVILDSKNFSDLISKVGTLNRLTTYNKNIINNLNESQKEVQKKQASLSLDKQNLLALKSSSESKLADLNNQKTAEAPLVAQAKSEENAAIASNSALKAQVDALNKKSQDMKNAAIAQQAVQTPKPNRGGGGGGIVSSNAVIQYASQFMETPYLYGGTTPSGFDCSGFVQYVYAHMGISLGRTTYDQVKEGSPVTGALQPGDLVFFGSPSAPHHVGIYVGNGQMIDAPQTGETIGIHNLYSDYSTARRVN
ncbi:MAG: NlpC/P60 family protein [Clostridium sp.]|nr:NlpC/P60 family protein [Clostridium sp.]